MRTTVEINDEHRAKLLEIAALRGKKGFSDLIEEALDLYFDAQRTAAKTTNAALAARGSLEPAQVDELREHADKLRRTWR